MTDQCAVDAFSRTCSSSASLGRQHVAERGKTTIHIPAELLCKIFSFAHANVYEYHQLSGVCPEEDKWLEQDLMSTSLFPYAPASVCTFWREVMSSMPMCWGRVVILIDPPATPLSMIASQLSWSRDGQLDVFITRRAFHNVDGRHEHSQVVAVMKLILSHIHRIRELSINVMFSSSLSSILTDFHRRGTATMMLKLELQCNEDDSGSDPCESVVLTNHQVTWCPKLKYLVIDGRNWYEAFWGDWKWTKMIATVVDLTISRFQPYLGELFSPGELLRPLHLIPNLRHLRITDLVLSPSLKPPWSYPNKSSVRVLDFENLHGFEAVGQIIRFQSQPHNISFTRCTFEDITDESYHFAVFGGVLHLTEINHDLAPLLRFWHGHTLYIKNCPRFDDSLIEEMTSLENGIFTCAKRVAIITIHDCPNFSIATLQRFVEARAYHPVNTSLWAQPTVIPRIQSVEFYGNTPSMSEVEKAWFDGPLPGFY